MQRSAAFHSCNGGREKSAFQVVKLQGGDPFLSWYSVLVLKGLNAIGNLGLQLFL